MRDVYHDQLDAVVSDLVEMTNTVSNAMARATTALLDCDLPLAEAVIAGDSAIDDVYHDIEERALLMLARQQPVASDLRTIVTSLRMVADIERAGDLALHVAKVARRRYPLSAVPKELRSTILDMGQVAQRLMTKTGDVIAGRDVQLAHEIERDDDQMDDLHRALFTLILDQQLGLETAIDITLVGRYYERFGDHAVSVARRVVYLVTGERVS
ncbi:MAG TPA: phosphate signaling complex protein PhoU [Mycobacteriales bacterium]|jgi:phosphate transport system protein|nr:phosphate signaling complex protein PhoU [Mycobacteriales bacterium]